MSFKFLPDVNIWLALSSRLHSHHPQAKAWFDSLKDDESILFCRFTQLGLLRLLTTEAVMGDETLTLKKAWHMYDSFVEKSWTEFVQEPHGLDAVFRQFTSAHSASPKTWADAYLAAFAIEADARLVTFDRALAGKAPGSVLLN